MSFVGRAAVWGHVNSVGDDVDRDRQQRLTSLNVMTGSRLAASQTGLMSWVDDGVWEDTVALIMPRLAAQVRRPYQQIFDAIRGRANRGPELRACPKCGKAPHNWGHAYERLVCTENTVA